jgi:signal transduction histidine kinase
VAARLLVIMVFVVGVLAAGLGVPLALADAQATQQDLFTQRLVDTIYYASSAERALTEADYSQLQAELRRYDEVYRDAVLVLDADRNVVVSSRTPVPELDADAVQRVELALARQPSERYPLLLPWDDRPLVLAEPVLDDTEVRGVVVTISSTAAVRADELRVWSLVAAAGLVALALGVLVALPVVRWILRPVRRLDEGTGRIASAVLAGADPEPVADGTGPPELRRLSESFDRMAATVAQAYSTQRAFVADASHQLRNPLTALRLRLSNLEGYVTEEAVDDHVAALEEAERLSTLLDGLLALARAERTAPVGEVDVDHGVDDRVDAWRPLAEHSGLELRREGHRELRATGPAGVVETVLDAVLDNAVKFTPAGGRVVVTTRADAHRVEIAVQDTGPGLPPDELDRALDRFWRSPGQINTEGSGLGLAIAARTLEIAGGELALELPDGGGLRAALPRVAGRPAAPAGRAGSSAPAPGP